MLVNNTLMEYLEGAKTSDMPGGGSVVAYVSALGAALTMMVNNLTVGKKVYEAYDDSIKADMKAKYDQLDAMTYELAKLVDEDSKSFDAVLKAYKMPKATDEEKKARANAIQEGYKKALEVPFETARISLEALKIQQVFADYGNIHGLTDQGCSALLLAAGVEGALLNVLINLKSIKDEDFRNEAAAKMKQYNEEAAVLKEQLMGICYGRLAKEL